MWSLPFSLAGIFRSITVQGSLRRVAAIHQKMIDFQDFTTQSIFAVTSRRSGTVQNRPIPALDDRYLL